MASVELKPMVFWGRNKIEFKKHFLSTYNKLAEVKKPFKAKDQIHASIIHNKSKRVP